MLLLYYIQSQNKVDHINSDLYRVKQKTVFLHLRTRFVSWDGLSHYVYFIVEYIKIVHTF